MSSVDSDLGADLQAELRQMHSEVPEPPLELWDVANQALGQRRSRRSRAVAALVAILMLLGGSFTQPGRAATGWLGELVGIDSEPTLPQSPETDSSAAPIVGQVEDRPYEVIVKQLRPFNNRPARDAKQSPPRKAQPCLQVDFPDRALSGGGGVCTGSNDPVGISRAFDYPFEAGGFGAPALVVGYASGPGVEDVIATADGAELPIRTAVLPVGSPVQLGGDAKDILFAVELDSELAGQLLAGLLRVDIRAIAADGEAVGRPASIGKPKRRCDVEGARRLDQRQDRDSIAALPTEERILLCAQLRSRSQKYPLYENFGLNNNQKGQLQSLGLEASREGLTHSEQRISIDPSKVPPFVAGENFAASVDAAVQPELDYEDLVGDRPLGRLAKTADGQVIYIYSATYRGKRTEDGTEALGEKLSFIGAYDATSGDELAFGQVSP